MLASGDLVAFVALHLADIPDLGAQHPLMVVSATMALADDYLRDHPEALMELNEAHGFVRRDGDGSLVPVAARFREQHVELEWAY